MTKSQMGFETPSDSSFHFITNTIILNVYGSLFEYYRYYTDVEYVANVAKIILKDYTF
ncbi:hypothetical protein [Clostridium magnum]|uniref:hypothetical protein n=1 Tax=Clostridium magnum TaxID=33954 RepID=UPI0013724592|nr:hypothetical protein [Clostridium magnum]